MSRRGVAVGLAGALLLPAVSGCGPTLLNLPRPGAGVASPNYQITAIFADALNLPDGAHVRVGGADIGRVVGISTRDFVARVRIRLPRRVVLTDAATAEMRMTTPLGEGFIDLDPGHGSGRLGDGSVIQPTATMTAASVEDMLAAASVLITGGGLAQIRTIAVELRKVLDGGRGDPRRLFRSLNDTLSTLNARTADIDKTLTALEALSGTLVSRRATLNAALKDAAPAAKLLADQTDKFSRLLARVADLGRVADRVVRATRADVISTLRSAEPVLDALISMESRLGPTLSQLVRFGKFLDHATPGDYLAGDGELTGVTFAGVPGASPELTLRQMWVGSR